LPNLSYDSALKEIKVLNDETPSTPNGVGTPNSELEAYPLAKVIQKVK
jgi:hypothetical protein